MTGRYVVIETGCGPWYKHCAILRLAPDMPAPHRTNAKHTSLVWLSDAYPGAGCTRRSLRYRTVDAGQVLCDALNDDAVITGNHIREAHRYGGPIFWLETDVLFDDALMNAYIAADFRSVPS